MKEKGVNFRLAVKAFIVNKNKLLIIKRASDDVQAPEKWEIPGGRLDLGEDPILGIIREVKEETGLYVRVFNPISVRHFVRDDSQVITMIVFLCKPVGGDIKLSEEHSDYSWEKLDYCEGKIVDFYNKELLIYKKLKKYFSF